MTVDEIVETRTSRIRHEFKSRKMTVVSADQLSPRMLRVVFGGDDLQGFVSADPGDHMKLAFPLPGTHLVMPVVGQNGTEWPADTARPLLRDFTPRRFDAATNQLTVDFVLHDEGPATTWARSARPGQVVGSLGPRGSKLVSGPFDWYLMIGDETALPSIARRLEEFPSGTRAIAILEVENAGEEQPISTQADAQITWVHRNGQPAGGNGLLEQALRATSLLPGEFYVWAGGEATTLKGIRRYLLREAGARPEWASFSGHWKVGIADHDHHEPIED